MYVPLILFSWLFVNVHVSLLYSYTDSTNVRNVRSFNDLHRDDFQILFNLLQDFHARAFLTFTSFAVSSIHDPRYLKLSTFLIISLFTVFRTVSCTWLKLMDSVLLEFRCKPIFAAFSWTRCRKFCACSSSSFLD